MFRGGITFSNLSYFVDHIGFRNKFKRFWIRKKNAFKLMQHKVKHTICLTDISVDCCFYFTYTLIDIRIVQTYFWSVFRHGIIIKHSSNVLIWMTFA